MQGAPCGVDAIDGTVFLNVCQCIQMNNPGIGDSDAVIDTIQQGPIIPFRSIQW
jgi:hypothetical protein